MAELKTQPTDEDVAGFLATVEPERRRQDAKRLLGMFSGVTGYRPVLWGGSMIGFGRYHYRYESGRVGSYFATGFAPRKSNLSIYILPGYTDYGDILARLGKHKTGKSCLYVNKLDDIDLEVLEELVRAGLEDLNRIWPVEPA